MNNNRGDSPATDQWHPASWLDKPMSQQIKYSDQAALNAAIDELASLPPLVSSNEVDSLKAQIASAQQGQCFILQGGDCAESFADCNAESISQKVRTLLSLSLLLSQQINLPITRVGRIAGQYAKPRSTLHENQDNQSLPNYRGDLVNNVHFSESARTPDPQRMLQGYSYASLTLNYIRSLFEGELSELFQLEQESKALKQLKKNAKLDKSLEQFRDAMQMFHQLNGEQAISKKLSEFFTSHEALHLHYEQALTRQSHSGQWYNLSTHFPWVGMRTVNPQSAHIEYLRGIANPVAIKVGPAMEPQALVELCKTLNPNNEAGRLTLIHRFGAKQIATKLPALITAIQQSEHKVLWSCDPMHGNTKTASNGVKTRHFADIQSEMMQAFNIHKEHQSHLGALHLELTGEAVMECVGGSFEISEDELQQAYTSLVDPRLNLSQAFELLSQVSTNVNFEQIKHKSTL